MSSGNLSNPPSPALKSWRDTATELHKEFRRELLASHTGRAA